MELATSLNIDAEFLGSENNKRPLHVPLSLISDYAQSKRLLPSNTPFPGYWKNSRTPYSVEIMDNMSPFSPIQYTAIMKAAQLGLTAAAENVIAYWIDESPSEILYISSTVDLLKKWGPKRLEPLIDSCGFRNKIFAQIENSKSRRSGDLTFSKEFVGGNLDMASAQSASSLRSDSKRIVIVDEMDGAPIMLPTGEGNWVQVADARTIFWGVRKKVLYISTPALLADSLINESYLDGDQRKFLVPCPMCGKFQALEFGDSKSQYGLKADTKAGELVSVYYLCIHCHDAIFNHQKTKMLNGGYWEPTAKSSDKTYRSYHLSSLYSPVGVFSWKDLYKKYLKSKKRPEGDRWFRNLYLGLPFRESGERPKMENVISLRGDYHAMTVPDGVLFVTAGVDVQTGSQTDTTQPARLELEILGHGAGYRTWSIAYLRIEGSIDDPNDGAWEELYQEITNGGLTFKRLADEREFPPMLMLIDSGDGTKYDIVYAFSERINNAYPSKGFHSIKRNIKDKGDEFSSSNYVRYKIKKMDESINLVEISTNHYKKIVYNRLNIVRQEEGPQRAGFCDFPMDYGGVYFEGLTAEERGVDGTFRCPSGRRNEPLDCRVENLCAGDIYINSLVHDYRLSAKDGGASKVETMTITQKTIIDLLIKQTARVIPK